ncbi:hypothetical protein MMC26_006161 [Xylographa opegraphella]|nr:hypothetical protein [Xylographa opegraphella]
MITRSASPRATRKACFLYSCLLLLAFGNVHGLQLDGARLARNAPSTPPTSFESPSTLVNQNELPSSQWGSIIPQAQQSRQERGSTVESFKSFPALLDALDVMQSSYFEVWQGIWPKAIDWTAAVVGTYVSASLSAITRSDWYRDEVAAATVLRSPHNVTIPENLINKYFSHTLSFYYGEHAFALRGQAFDDMLWVVLGWLESIKFISLHSDLHYKSLEGLNESSIWYARQFIPAFAHRARVFYDLASKGWDTSLCDGGMIWSPYLTPYKNAITNQLYISASVSMYLHFPGDYNSSPFMSTSKDSRDGKLRPATPHDPKYLEAAVKGYKWLVSSNMTNRKGLFVDGFHIRGWRGDGRNGSTGSGQCDVRDEQVYTYNQGVILSGLRGLWEATGAWNYLEDGHKLIRNVISATGWGIEDADERRKWAGIGRNGILEESCDAKGTCSQDGQTFKGIFFHHMTAFCASLPVGDVKQVPFSASADLASVHTKSCQEYGPWIRHNAEAAYRTRDSKGRFGTWWTYGLWHNDTAPDNINTEVPDQGTDYRNYGVPKTRLWRFANHLSESFPEDVMPGSEVSTPDSQNWSRDPNGRGRGRTVETQSGGVAVLRALYGVADTGWG